MEKWLSRRKGEKGKTLTRRVFYGFAALREIRKDQLISAEGMVSLNRIYDFDTVKCGFFRYFCILSFIFKYIYIFAYICGMLRT